MSERARNVLARSRVLTPQVSSESERDAVKVLERNREFLRGEVEAQRRRELLALLPQGAGSGLDADMVDGLHASEIIAKAAVKGPVVVERVGGGGGGTNVGDMTKAVYDPDGDGVVVDSAKLEGATLAQVRDHAPKVHAGEAHSVNFDYGAFLLGSFKKVEAVTWNGDGTLAQSKIYDAASALIFILDFTYSGGIIQSIAVKDGSGVLQRTYTVSWNGDGSFEKVEMS